MIREIKGYPMFEGFREETVDTSVLEEILLKVIQISGWSSGNKGNRPEPIFAYKDGAVTVMQESFWKGMPLLESKTGEQRHWD